MRLYFVTVPTLVDFYKSQNALAAAGARTQAQLTTQATLTREELRSREKSEKQRQSTQAQIEQFKQQMENLRSSRELSSAERQFQTEQLRKDMQASLGRKTDLEKAEISRTGAAERTQASIEARAPLVAAQTEKATQGAITEQQQRPKQQQKLSAEAELATEKLRIAQSPDLLQAQQELDYLRENKGALRKDNKEAYDRRVRLAGKVLLDGGVQPMNQSNYLEATVDSRNEFISDVQTSLKTYADDTKHQAAVQSLQNMYAAWNEAVMVGQPQSVIDEAQGVITDFMKEHNLTEEEGQE